MHARLRPVRQTGTQTPVRPVRGRPWKATVHTDRDEAQTPSAMRPWTPRHDGPQRNKVTHHGTEKKQFASTRIRS
jgi:hypothetical protein